MSKSSNKLIMMLTAIALLLVFGIAFGSVSSTNSWLKDSDTAGFMVTISNIDIKVKQTITQTVDDGNGGTTENTIVREIGNGGYIYIGDKIIEADKEYDLNVSILNNENTTGYYLRFKAVAIVDGVEYNINEYITSDFYIGNDGWGYNTASKESDEPIAMEANQEKVILDTMTIPATASAGKLGLNNVQGKRFTLKLIIEGSPDGVYSA